MRKFTIEEIVEEIRDLLLSAVDLSGQAKFEMLTHILKIGLAELSELGEEDATAERSPQAPIPISSDRLPDVIGSYDWDIVNKVVYADPDVAQIYNVSAENAERGVPQDEFGAAIYPDDMPNVAHAVSYALSAGNGFSVVYRLVQADGSLKAVLAIGHVIFNSGVPVNFKGTIVNVTEEDALHQRFMKYRNADTQPYCAKG